MCLYTSIYRWNGEKCVNGRKENSTNLHHLSHPIPVSDTWNKVGIDLIELPVSKKGNQYCITLTDYFSKWTEACPVPTKEATHVAAFLYRMIPRHGCPQEIISDQGRELCNKLVDSLEEWAGFKHKITSAYHFCNPMDRMSGLIKRSSISFKGLSMVLFAYRSSRQDSMKWTPFLLMYGRETRLPIDLTRVQPEDEAQELDFELKIAKNAGTSKEAPWTSICKSSESPGSPEKKQYEGKHNIDTRITVGDKVLVKSMKNESRRVEKLELQFTGPNTVAKDIGKGRYHLQHHNGNLLKTAINCHHLKICHDPDGGSVSFVCTQCQWPTGMCMEQVRVSSDSIFSSLAAS